MCTRNKHQMLSEMIQKAFECQQKEQHNEAIIILSKMIEIEPDNSDAHHYLGLSYMHQHNYQKAISEMEIAIKLSPHLDYYYCNLGLAYWRIEQRDRAIDCFKRGYQINQENRYIQFNLAQVLYDEGKIEKSLTQCYQYMEKYPNDYYVFFLLIVIEHRLCRKDLVLTAAVKQQVSKNVSIDKWLGSIPETDDKLLFTKGILFTLFDRIEQGIQLLKRAEKKLPGSGWIFTYKIISQIKYQYASSVNKDIKKESRSVNTSNYQGVISMNDLGLRGRLGHEIQYYLGLKQYAKKHNYCIEVSDWLGRYLFEGCDDPYISGIYKTFDSSDPAFIKSLNGAFPPPKKRFNLRGGCFHMPETVEDKNYIQKLLTLKPFWRKKIDPCIQNLKKNFKTLLTIHFRRGDFIKDGRYVPSSQIYLEWLEQIWPSLDQPVLYIASDEAEKVQADFWKYNPFIGKHFGDIIKFDDFLTDYYIMSQSDILVMGTSSFSRVAAMCNKVCSQFYWANPESKRIEPLTLFPSVNG